MKKLSIEKLTEREARKAEKKIEVEYRGIPRIIAASNKSGQSRLHCIKERQSFSMEESNTSREQ